MFSVEPPERSLEILLESFDGVASITRCATKDRRTFRAIGITIHGNGLARVAPSPSKARRIQGKNFGVIFLKRYRFLAATLRLSGRITPSTNPTAKSKPFGSCSRPERRSAAGELFCWEAASTQCCTCSITAADSSDLAGITGISVELSAIGLPSFVFYNGPTLRQIRLICSKRI